MYTTFDFNYLPRKLYCKINKLELHTTITQIKTGQINIFLMFQIFMVCMFVYVGLSYCTLESM